MAKNKKRKKAEEDNEPQAVDMRTVQWVDIRRRCILWGIEMKVLGKWMPCTVGMTGLVFNYQYDACAYLEMIAQEKGITWSVG